MRILSSTGRDADARAPSIPDESAAAEERALRVISVVELALLSAFWIGIIVRAASVPVEPALVATVAP